MAPSMRLRWAAVAALLLVAQAVTALHSDTPADLTLADGTRATAAPDSGCHRLEDLAEYQAALQQQPTSLSLCVMHTRIDLLTICGPHTNLFLL